MLTLCYYLQGQLYSEEGRTKAYYRVVYGKGNRLWTSILFVLLAMLAAVFAVLAGYSLASGATISTAEDAKFMLTAGLLVIAFVGLLVSRRGHKRPKGSPPPELKAFFLARLQAVERWEE